METLKTNKFYFLTVLVLGAALTRLLPHYPNFTAIGGLALFSGAYFDKKIYAFLVPLTALLLTDMIIGFHSTVAAVYISFAVIALLGSSLKGKVKVQSVLLTTVTASVLFFVVTNTAAWYSMGLYPKTLSGLAMCFTAAVPFFHTTLLGDLFFSSVLFGAYELAKFKMPVLVKA